MMSSIAAQYNVSTNTIIRWFFPHTKLVADNFHLVQMTLCSLNQIRVQLMKQFKDRTRE
ncbi:DDE_Tnp_ISL3 domain-containing protein [Lactiplantibacillus plantarum]|nr:transposase [Lactiplantibacillus plantarum]MBU7457509.1 transposase [Lactiplantibacillus plantarum]MBW2757623.1 transposase [Lactiplantibacillus plantarum]MCT3260925.1 hypothetical protein [Lactiplantibacillus plantarum]MCT4441558.1 hypothetical protein [Lactiplantibacillus plantarum]